jgi:hypothetical protein
MIAAGRKNLRTNLNAGPGGLVGVRSVSEVFDGGLFHR